jgi:hypothetical protein
MMQYNKQILIQLKLNNQDASNINLKSLMKTKNLNLLINERKQNKTLNYMEKQFQIMINNMSREDLFKMLEHSALYFKNEFEMIDTKVNEKEEDYNANNESE